MISTLFKIPIKYLRLNRESNLIRLRFLHNQTSNNFTISFLINSCGLSPQSALSISEKIQLKSSKNPNFLIQFLKSNEFTNTQITNLIRKCPSLLQSNVDKTLKPKFDYLQSVGLSKPELASIVSSVPHILTSSLENRLKPNFELITSFIGDNRKLASAVKQNWSLLRGNLEKNFLPNVKILQFYGVPRSNIDKIVANHPRVVMLPTEKFSVTVGLIKEMGFNPLSMMFIHGVAAVSRFGPSTWEKKMLVFKSLGWSEEEVITAFAKQPFCMLVSDEKIKKVTDFYVKRLNWGPSFLAKRPVLLCMSFEKRVVPRCSALSVLHSKGLVIWNSTVSFLTINEKDFLDRYVTSYVKTIPEVLEAYKGNLEFAGVHGR